MAESAHNNTYGFDGGVEYVLDGKYGTLEPDFPTDPYQFIVWWYCGYPQSQKACAKGWASLTRVTKIEPDDLLRAPPGRLTEALRPGGMVPELRSAA